MGQTISPVTASLVGLLWVFGWAAVILVAWHLRARRRDLRLKLIHEERMKAMEKDIPLPELPELETKRRPRWLDGATNPRWPLGVGAMLILLGIGLSVALYLSGDPYHNQVWPFGLLGVFGGVGLFLHYLLTRPTRPGGY